MTDDPTLDPGLGNVLFDAWLLSRVTTARLDGALNGSELDADEFAIYSILLSNEHATTPSTLARWTAAPPRPCPATSNDSNVVAMSVIASQLSADGGP